MDKSNSTMAQQIAEAASAFEQLRTGHGPKSVTVVLSEDTLVITLHGALSPAEKALAQTPAGAAQVQDFHRQLFTDSADSLAAGDQTNHRRRRSRSDCRSRDQDGHCRACVHERYDGAGVSARPRHSRGHLERQMEQSINHEHGARTMLVLSRKSLESVVVGGSGRFEPMLKVTVLEIKHGSVRLGFEAIPTFPSIVPKCGNAFMGATAARFENPRARCDRLNMNPVGRDVKSTLIERSSAAGSPG